MSYSATYDERYYGNYWSSNAGDRDAYSFMNSNFTLAEGSIGYGDLTHQSPTADTDVYSLGVLSSGYYSADVSTYTWDFANAGYGGISQFQVLNSSGGIIGTSYSTFSDIDFTVSSSGTYYIRIVGNYYNDQQYSVVYDYVGALNSDAVWGSSASYTGFLRSGETIDASVTYSDADENSDGIVSTAWYLNGVYKGLGYTFTLSDEHVGQILSFRFKFYDDAGELEESNTYVAGTIDYGATLNHSTTTTLPDTAHVLNLTLLGSNNINGTGNSNNNTIKGNSGNNILNGGTGRDTLIGGGGNDTYVTDGGDAITEASNAGSDTVQSSATATLGSNVENLTLTGSLAINGTGNTLNNVITGNSAANTLNGGSGNDTLIGGAGNDIYVTDGGDTITEASNAGTDTVQSSATATLGSNLENLTLTGSSVSNGTGNTLNNVITGNSAANTLNGGTGTDTLIGGSGNDIYVTDGGDTITEASGSGTDTVQSSATATLGLNLENLTLTGSSAINGTGNTLNNILTGNSGNNILNGGSGKDVLTGAAGNDTFIFNSVVESAITETTSDVIADFVRGKDKINLSAIDAFASSTTNDAFVWNGTAAFSSATQGEVRFEKFDKSGTANDYTMIWIDNDRDSGVEMAIRLTGLHNLTASDFIL